MEVTREYIMKHRTARGAWTLAQIQALGLVWPPLQGWIDSVVGQTITDEQARRFENNTIPRKGAAKTNPDQMQLF
jgi:hypothetical protein